MTTIDETTAPAMGAIRRGETGSALLITVMITVILTLLGISYLAIADQENSIAVNQRNADQLTFVAESGARMVKAWFDRPVEGPPASPVFKFMGDYDLRKAGLYDRTQRIFDHDGDPTTAEVLADGSSSRPYFRQGLTVGSDPNYLSLWNKPYRGSNVAEFRGTEAGPDIVLEAASNGTSFKFLDIANMRVISQNKTVQETVGRIQRIDVYAPPIIEIGGIRTRYGIATVKVTAAKFKRLGKIGIIPVVTPNSVEVGRQVTKMVLNEVPYPGPNGPFHTCSTYDVNGEVEIHWGEIISSTTLSVGPQLIGNTLRSVPWASYGNMLTGADLQTWVTTNNGQTDADFDPWFLLRAGAGISGAPDPNASQLYPYVPTTTVANDQTALFQNIPVGCPDFDYAIWKSVALSGGQNVHYMVHRGTDSYAEDGTGTAKNVHDWTHGQEGFWFFDTIDRLPPDPNGSNLGGQVGMSGSWNTAGFIYLNAHWNSSGVGGGTSRVIIPPGEPWKDANSNGVPEPGEYVNLSYRTSLSGTETVREYNDPAATQTGSETSSNGVTYTYTTDPNGRDDQGPPFSDNLNLLGVLYVSGEFEFTGNMVVFGAVITQGGMVNASPSAGTPDVYFDERLIKGAWPPPELQLPRTMITFWETDL